MPWYLYLALRQLFPSGRRFPFFTAISVASVALGVALMISVSGVMGGFGHEIHRMMRETQGEVQVRGASFIDDPKSALAVVEKVPGVRAATPFAEGVCIVIFNRKPAYPMLQGVDPGRVEKVVPLGKYVRMGSIQDLDDDSVILSSMLASSLGARIGSQIEIYTPLILDKMSRDEILLPRQLKVVGIIEVGHQQLDSSTVICTLRLMQDLYGMGHSVHGLNIALTDGADADTVAMEINAASPVKLGLNARSWREINQDFLRVLQIEKSMILFIMMFVVVVAAFLTMSLLLVLVIKKTREIGLLAALGAGRRQIALCFCFQGFGIGVVGTGIGLILGFLALHFRNDVVFFILRLTGQQGLLAQFYQFAELPAHTESADVIIIVVSAILLSTLAGLAPAVLAARMKPVEALRSE